MGLFGKKKLPLTDEEQDKIVSHIQKAEAGTTGEVRIYMEGRCNYVDALDRAEVLFSKLGMENTVMRNAVLVYLAYDDHQFAIYGDKEVYQEAEKHLFWEHAAQHLKTKLIAGKMCEGLCDCIDEIGAVLATHYPYDPNVNKNELPDEIVFGN